MLTSEELSRYERQLILPQIGEQGQEKLKSANVFIAGLGGLGSVCAFYMAAAGIGHITIVDRETVELGNLNRQILHRTDDIGLTKAESAYQKLQALNPLCRISAFHGEICADNVLDLVKGSEIILDATDNIQTRKMLNWASIQLRIPFIYGGINGFDGSVSTFIPGKTACFECLFGEKTDSDSPIGVIGPTPGIIGAIQCIEAIKIILGMNGLLENVLMFFSGADISIKKIQIEPNPNCKICGAIHRKNVQ